MTEPTASSPTRFCPSCGAAAGAGRFCANCGADLTTGSGAQPPTAEARPGVNVAAVVALIAAALVAAGSFLPWITATAAFVGTITRSGLDGGGDGVVTLVAAVVIAIGGLLLATRPGSPSLGRLATFAGGVLAGLILAADYSNISERVRSISSDVATASVGAGLYVIGLGAVLAVVAAIAAKDPRRQAKAA
jgi:hypothetical protein